MRHARLARLAAGLALPALVVCTPALARPGFGGGFGGGWGQPGWGMEPWRGGGLSERARHDGPVEGRVTVSRFVAEGSAAEALGKGTISAIGTPSDSGTDSRELATYEAAVIDQLAQIGYKTDIPAGGANQLVELHISHDEVAPQEIRKPVSGEATVGVSNRGSMVGLAVAVDLSKPKGALVASRLEARIRDRVSGAVLWEGRADTITREGSDKWSQGAIAARLASALFDRFPGNSGEMVAGG